MSKLLPGCDTPQDQNLKTTFQNLAQIFAPVLVFDPGERFFPVDLPSAVAASALYRLEGQDITNHQAVQVKNFGAVTAVDLDQAQDNFFTTVAGWDTQQVQIDNLPPVSMPLPKVEEIYQKYFSGAIPAKLTCYATVCFPRQTPNYHLLQANSPRSAEVRQALPEGLLLNYYFYFPVMETPELKHEGDWAGISLLFPRLPNLQQLNQDLPVLACYFKKISDFYLSGTFFVAGKNGFLRWDKVPRRRDLATGLDTHPLVYISRGRHNCYYRPSWQTIPPFPPWNPTPDPGKIETGAYYPGPAGGGTLIGGGESTEEIFPTWALIVFPPAVILEICGHICEELPIEFDSSGLPPAIEDGEDTIKEGGYETAPEAASTPAPPAGDSFPPPHAAAGPSHYRLNVEYVDLTDPRNRSLWGYPGFWGAAEAYLLFDTQNNQLHAYDPDARYGGLQRPNLGAWFLFNLYTDPVYGSYGKIAEAPPP